MNTQSLVPTASNMVISTYVSTDIQLSEIIPDPKQPRRHFDPVEMQEMTISVQLHGILQPITVRLTDEGKYKIVFGECRYRAALAVMSLHPERNTIPAYIRELNDDEAFLLQIVENLHRKNIPPLDEAESFKRLHAKETIEEIALRIGKAPSYIAQRMKLCDLIPGWQEILMEKKIKLKTAFKIARLPIKAQEQMYQQVNLPQDWKDNPEWELPHWINGNVKSCSLEGAPFDITDPDLYPQAGACSTCQFNSHANLLLFPDMQFSAVCSNATCFDLKASQAYQKRLEEVMKDPDMLFVNTTKSWYQQDELKLAAAKELGIHILPAYSYQQLEAPETPLTWEEFRGGELEYTDLDEMTDEERAEWESECKEDYQTALDNYQEELQEYMESPARAYARKAFVVSGDDAGSIIDIIVTKSFADTSGSGSPANGIVVNAELLEVEEQIQGNLARSERNKELDREKIYKSLVELFKVEDDAYHSNTGVMSEEECAAFLFTLATECSSVNHLVTDELKVQADYYGVTLFNAILEKQTTELLQKAFRLFVTSKLINATDLDYGKRGRPAAIYALGKQYFPSELADIEDKQNTRARKRQMNADLRLKALQKRRDKLVSESTVDQLGSTEELPEMEPEMELAEEMV